MSCKRYHIYLHNLLGSGLVGCLTEVVLCDPAKLFNVAVLDRHTEGSIHTVDFNPTIY